MAHDQTFKDVLHSFFHDFLTLFMPGIASGIDPDAITFLDPQTFTDIPEGLMRTADVVAEVRSLVGKPEIVLLHTEVQTESDAVFAYRVWEYNALLTLRHHRSVISAALLPFSRTGDVRKVCYVETLFGEEYIKLEYWQIGLRGLSAEDYKGAASVLGAALAALMQPGPEGRVELKIDIIRCLRESGLDEARLFLLVDLVETYLTLDEPEQMEYGALLQAEGDQVVEATELTWAQKISLRTRREDVKRAIGLKFGRMSPELEVVIDSIDTEAGMTSLFDRVFTSESESELLSPSR